MREFLQRVLPWFPPPEGTAAQYYNTHWTFQIPGEERLGWTGRACTTLDQLVSAVEFGLRGPDPHNVYVCMSSQSEYTAKTSRAGRSYSAALRNQDNVVWLRSLFLDVDVDATKPNTYRTTRDAMVGLADFLKASGMPRPTLIVQSGSGGFHCHWCLDTPLRGHEWKPLAQALQNVTQKVGFLVDGSCTIDSARVLRIPDTLNHKHTPPKPVTMGTALPFDYTLDSIKAILAPHMGAITLPPRAPIKGGNELSAGVERQARPVDITQVATQCAFVAGSLATGGANNPEPLWRDSLMVALYTTKPDENAHLLSKGHAGYDVAKTDAKFAQLTQQKAQKDFGWISCQAIKNHGCSACLTCPHANAGKSPLNLAPPATQVLQVSLELPEGYSRDPDGLVYMLEPQADGSTRAALICQYPVVDPWVQKDPWIFNFTTSLEYQKRKQVYIPLDALASKDGFTKSLARQGVVMFDPQYAKFKGLLVAWISKLQRQKDAVISSSPFGWDIDHGKVRGFIYGGKVMTDDGSEKAAANPDPVIQMQYTPCGDVTPWVTAAKMVTDQNRFDIQAILASAFGAPLVRFTGQSGLLLSAYSTDSGIGKSSTQKVAQAVWGHPTAGRQALDDTVNSVINKIGQLKALPLYWDEIRGEHETAKFVKLVFQLGQGKEKSRLSADSQQRAPGTWQTMLCCCSNDSLADYVMRQTKTTTAGMYRVFEFTVARGVTGQIDQADAARMVDKLEDNHGQAGLIYAKFLGEKHAAIAQLVAAKQKDLTTRFQAKTDERFWFATMTCLIMGAILSNRLGLTAFDTKGLEQYLIDQLMLLRAHRTSVPVDIKDGGNVASILQAYLTQQQGRHTLVTDKYWLGSGRPPQNVIKVLSNINQLDGVYVHIAQDQALLRIRSPHFRNWLQENGYSPGIVVDAVRQEFSGKTERARLGAGTPFHDTLIDMVITMDLNDPTLASVVGV